MKMYFIDMEFTDNTVIALGLVELKENGLSINRMFHPGKGRKVTHHVHKLTGISDKMLEGKPTLSSDFKRVFSFLKDEPGIVWAWGENDGAVLNGIDKDKLVPIKDFQMVIRRECKLTAAPGLVDIYHALGGNANLVNHKAIDDAKMLRYIYKQYNANKQEARSKIRLVEYRRRLRELDNWFLEIGGAVRG